jgi:hypothetical protein
VRLGLWRRRAPREIDLFMGAAATRRTRTLVIIDNSANWNAASQHWVGAGGESVQAGPVGLRALRRRRELTTSSISA